MTKYIKREEVDSSVIAMVAADLRNGSLAVFPTDTVYGIGTNAYDQEACERIYEVKGRPKYKPLVLLISDVSMLEEMVDSVHPIEQKLIDTFWPGPLTIKFLKKKDVLPDIVSAGDSYLRARLMNEGFTCDLIRATGVPLVAPSANLSGSPTGTKMENIVRELDGKVDYIFDFGDIESDEVSTIVEVQDGKISVIREGKISKQELAKIAEVI